MDRLYKLYKILHKPTGLFFKPSSEILIKFTNGSRLYVKSNLSTKGKIYYSKPNLSWCETIYNHLLLKNLPYEKAQTERWKVQKTQPNDWEIVEI